MNIDYGTIGLFRIENDKVYHFHLKLFHDVETTKFPLEIKMHSREKN